MPSLKRLPAFCLALILFGIIFTANAEARQSFSSRASDVDRLLITIPDPDQYDICGYIWKNYAPKSIKGKKKKFPKNIVSKVPKQFRSMMETVSFKPEKLFKNQCSSYKKQLIDSIKEPFVSAQKQLDEARKSYLNIPLIELRKGFYSWVAFTARDYILPTLPEKEREKFQPDSAYAQEKAQEWLKEPNREIDAYVKLYLKEHHQLLSAAYLRYLDWTDGQSRKIIDGFAIILTDAEKKLQRIGKLQAELTEPAKRKTPYAKMLKKSGFSGKWLDNFKAYEGDFNILDKQYDIVAATNIVVNSFQTKDPTAKVDAMFELLDNLAGTAANSHLPIVSLFGDIIQAYVQVGKQMLGAVNDLGAVLRKRSGYCIGTGVPIGREGIDRYAEAKQYAEQFKPSQQELICPLAFDKYPWKHVYEATELPSGRLFFWDGKKFIVGRHDGGGKAGAQESVRIISAARSLNYQITEEKQDGVKLLAQVYNTSFSGAVPALLEEAQEVMEGIAELLQKQEKMINESEPQCSQQDFRDYLKHHAGLDASAFEKELSVQGLERLVATYAASYTAKEGGFGKKNTARGNAYGRYKKIREKTKTLNFRKVVGRVVDEQDVDAPCPECGNAELDISMEGGLQMPSCEVAQADMQGQFILWAITLKPEFEITIQAKIENSKSDRRRLTEKDFERWDEIAIDLPILLKKEKSSPGFLSNIRSIKEKMGALRAQTLALVQQINRVGFSLADQVNQINTQFKEIESKQDIAKAALQIDDSFIDATRPGIEEITLSIVDIRRDIEGETLNVCKTHQQLKKTNKISQLDQIVINARTSNKNVAEHFEQYIQYKKQFNNIKAELKQVEQELKKFAWYIKYKQQITDMQAMIKRGYGYTTEVEKLMDDIQDNQQKATALNSEMLGLIDKADVLNLEAPSKMQLKKAKIINSYKIKIQADTEDIYSAESKISEEALYDETQLAALADRLVWFKKQLVESLLTVSGDTYSQAKERLKWNVSKIDAAEIFYNLINAANNNAKACLKSAEELYSKKTPYKEREAQADCSAYLGTKAKWYAEVGEVRCDCIDADKKYNQKLGRCATRKEFKVAKANCTDFPGTQAQWHEDTQDVRCDCVEAGKKYNSQYGRCISRQEFEVGKTDCSKWSNSKPIWDRSNQQAVCGCKGDYQWNKVRSACIRKPDLQIAKANCSKWPNSKPIWNKNKERVECSCVGNYEWNRPANTACRIKKEIQVAQFNCKQWPNSVASWDRKKQAPYCVCKGDYELNKANNTCRVKKEIQVAEASCDRGMHPQWSEKHQEVRCYCDDGAWSSSKGRCISEREQRLARQQRQREQAERERQWEEKRRKEEQQAEIERQQYCQKYLRQLNDSVAQRQEAWKQAMNLTSAYGMGCDQSDITAAQQGRWTGGRKSGAGSQSGSRRGSGSTGVITFTEAPPSRCLMPGGILGTMSQQDDTQCMSNAEYEKAMRDYRQRAREGKLRKETFQSNY